MRHILTALGDSSRGGQIPVLSVHVVGATTGVITQPDAEVLHLQWSLLVYLVRHKIKAQLAISRQPQDHIRNALGTVAATMRPQGSPQSLKESLPHQTTVDGLAGRLLHLPQLRDEVPEAGLGHHMVGGEDPHAVQGRSGVLGGGQKTPDHFIFPQLSSVRVKCYCRGIERVTKFISGGPGHGVLNLEFTFNGTSASEKGDKIQLVLFAQQIQSFHTLETTFGFACMQVQRRVAGINKNQWLVMRPRISR